MSPFEIGTFAIGALLVLILIGLPIGIGMLSVSFVGVALIRNDTVATRMMAQVANDSLEEYLFAVVPLFVLMGLLVTVSGVGKDTFDVFQKLLKRFVAGLGIATVFANAVFASITGISIASATVFSRIAVPEMRRHGYTRSFATGVVAGSSVLGMLIPPSLLMIVYAVLAEQSVGRMFLAGVGPGLLLSGTFAVTILILATTQRGSVFETAQDDAAFKDISAFDILRKSVPILSLMLVVLGGLYGGYLNPTEAGAAGFDLIWFGVVTVIAVEIGLLTPPFGLSVYTIKSAMDDPDLKVGEIFRGAFPFVLAMLVTLAIIVAVPSIATWLVRV